MDDVGVWIDLSDQAEVFRVPRSALEQETCFWVDALEALGEDAIHELAHRQLKLSRSIYVFAVIRAPGLACWSRSLNAFAP